MSGSVRLCWLSIFFLSWSTSTAISVWGSAAVVDGAGDTFPGGVPAGMPWGGVAGVRGALDGVRAALVGVRAVQGVSLLALDGVLALAGLQAAPLGPVGDVHSDTAATSPTAAAAE